MKAEKFIDSIRSDLVYLVEDRSLPMDVKVHEALWQEIQTIDVQVKEGFEE